jgi:haloalkane dehalogenase
VGELAKDHGRIIAYTLPHVEVFRTPDERFESLPGYDFEPRYADIDGLRMHYVDEGSGSPVVCFHGEPTWAYLYRKISRPLLDAGHRVVCPDYAGFGRSDKPTDRDWYSYDGHVELVSNVLGGLDLTGATVVVQDWGGPIGLRVATEMQERFKRLVVLNTGLFASSKSWPTPGFMQWRSFAERVGMEMPVGRIIQLSTATELDEATLAGYEAPWPVSESKAGVAAFPLLVPLSADDPNAQAMLRVMDALRGWDVPALVCWSDGDPVFPLKAGHAMAALLPGSGGRVHELAGASHMLQEDRGEEIARLILDFAS